MLRVDEQPVETSAGHDLGRIVAGQRAPQADLSLACLQRTLECVDRKIHSRCSPCQMNCTDTPPSGPKSAWMVSPLAAHTGRVNDPDSMMFPASSVMPKRLTLLANHAMPIAG